MSTIFTKIIAGEIPSYKIAEDEHHYAFLDINPIAKGHTLVVPKLEVDYVFDLEDEVLAELMVFAKQVAMAIDDALSTIRTGIIVEGLEVPHAHIHLVPIYDERQPVYLGHKVEVSKEEMVQLAERISKSFKS